MVGIAYSGPAFHHYCNMRFYIQETKAYRTSATYDLFPQHFQLLTLSNQKHNNEVAKEWIESVQRLKNKPKKAAIKDLKKAIKAIINGGVLPASEGEEAATEGVRASAPTVSTSTNPTNPRVLRNKPRTHLRKTRHNTLGAASPLVTEEAPTRRSLRLHDGVGAPRPTGEPNSGRISLHQPNIITQAAVGLLTENVYYGANSACWTPKNTYNLIQLIQVQMLV